MVHDGIGRHEIYLMSTLEGRARMSQAIKWHFLSQPLVIASMMFIRLSICIFLLRIFGTTKGWRSTLYAILIITIATNVSSTAVTVAQCSPVRKMWNPTLPGKCWPKSTQIAMGDFHGGTSHPARLMLYHIDADQLSQ